MFYTLEMKNQSTPITMKIDVLGEGTQRKKVNRVSFNLASINSSGTDGAVDIDAWTVNNVCVPLESVKFDKRQCRHLKNLDLSECLPRKAVTVDVLVGVNQYYRLVQSTIKRGKAGTPVATKSKLGWLPSGPVPGSSSKSKQPRAFLTVAKVKDAQSELRRFWELDAIGITDQPMNTQLSKYTPDERSALEQYDKSVTFNGERYTVGLPWKKSHPPLVDN